MVMDREEEDAGLERFEGMQEGKSANTVRHSFSALSAFCWYSSQWPSDSGKETGFFSLLSHLIKPCQSQEEVCCSKLAASFNWMHQELFSKAPLFSSHSSNFFLAIAVAVRTSNLLLETQ